MPEYICDTREPDWRTGPLIRAGWRLETLKYGDYAGGTPQGETWLIEHKTVPKLLQDMTDGVLSRQSRNLIENCQFPILMVEGHWTQINGHLANSRYTWHEAWNYLQTLQDMGMRLQLTTSTEHTIDRIIQLASYYAKDSHESAYRHLAGDGYLGSLCFVYGIGIAKAREIKQRYPTLAMLCEAEESEIASITGIGPTLARRIWQFLHEESHDRIFHQNSKQ